MEKTTIIAALVAGTAYVTALFFIAAYEMPDFWFWSSIVAWGFLAIFLIHHLRTHVQPPPIERWSSTEQEIIKTYIQQMSTLISSKWSPTHLAIVYEAALYMLLSTVEKRHFYSVEAYLTTILTTEKELTGASKSGNVVSHSSTGETHDHDSKTDASRHGPS